MAASPDTIHTTARQADEPVTLARRLGFFDATMIVMGGIIGSGIFMNPSVVARIVHEPLLIFGAWFVGGAIALLGGFVYAELAARRPKIGGSYAYLYEAFHPVLAFMFGWSVLLISETGGMAAVAMTFARYFLELTGLPISDIVVAVATLMGLTVINCFGVRAGSNVQNTLMTIKILAILMLVGVGYVLVSEPQGSISTNIQQPLSFGLFSTFGAALVPVLFAYGGWQTSNFIAGEIKEPGRNLPRALVVGVIGVVVLYLSVNFVCVRALGAEGLAATSTPASTVMRMALGETGARLIAVGIAISTLGFLSQTILVAPRVYYAMASDGLFFKSVARIHPRTRVPVTAIVIQGILASALTLSGTYEEILNYVVLDDFVFFGLSAACIFVFRRSFLKDDAPGSFSVPGHPYTTIGFIIICCFVVMNTLFTSPKYGALSIAVMLLGIPVYFCWAWWRKTR